MFAPQRRQRRAPVVFLKIRKNPWKSRSEFIARNGGREPVGCRTVRPSLAASAHANAPFMCPSRDSRKKAVHRRLRVTQVFAPSIRDGFCRRGDLLQPAIRKGVQQGLAPSRFREEGCDTPFHTTRRASFAACPCRAAFHSLLRCVRWLRACASCSPTPWGRTAP